MTSVDVVRAAPSIDSVHPRQNSGGQSGRDTRRDEKSRRPAGDYPEVQDPSFLNALGEVIGKTINITA